MELKRCTRTTRLTNFYPIPRSILTLNLPATAVLIYGILLDRATLSQKNDYTDATGWVYVVYTQEELAANLGISTRMIQRYVDILCKSGLIKRHRVSRKNANRYYILLPEDAVMGTGRGQECPSDGTYSAFMRGQIFPPNNRKEQQDISNLYQHREEESL